LPQVERADVLIVDEIGKDISGDGADPNVINRDVAGIIDFTHARPVIQRAIVRGLTEDTEGNATGIGMFDFTLRRVVDAMDTIPTYMNMITAKSPQGAKVPITVENDRQALSLAVASALKVEPGQARIIRIASTKSLDRILMSAPLLQELRESDAIEGIDDLREIAFDADGMFVDAV
jgi:hypothetical protein